MKIGFFDRVLFVMAGTLLVALFSTVTLGIISRAANHPFSWTEEASGFLMVWLVCFGWMIASRRNAHIRIRFFQDKLSVKHWRITEVTLQLAVAALGLAVAWNSIHLITSNSDVEAVTLPLSTAWMYVPLLPAGLVTLVQASIEIWGQVSGQAPAGKKEIA
jgi:TRAP-type transport system small permease protein